MKRTRFLILMAATITTSTLFFACQKDESDTPPIPDTVKKLMYDWKITNITTPKKNEANTDSVISKSCMTDDIIKMSATGFDFQDGTNKCDSTVFPYSKGVWAYDLTKDSIRLGSTTPVKYLSWKVLKLNDSVLQVKYIDSTTTSNKLVKTISFKR